MNTPLRTLFLLAAAVLPLLSARATTYINNTTEAQTLLITKSSYKDTETQVTKTRWTDHNSENWEQISSPETETSSSTSYPPNESETRVVQPGDSTYIEDFETVDSHSAEYGGMDRISETLPNGDPIFEEKWTYKISTEYITRTYQVM